MTVDFKSRSGTHFTVPLWIINLVIAIIIGLVSAGYATVQVEVGDKASKESVAALNDKIDHVQASVDLMIKMHLQHWELGDDK